MKRTTPIDAKPRRFAKWITNRREVAKCFVVDKSYLTGIATAPICDIIGKKEFVAVDMPQMNRLTVHIIAAVAEHERELISTRTKAALAEAKKRGRVLGNPHWQRTISRAWDATRAKAGAPAPQTVDLMRQLRAEGRSYRAIADHLNIMGLRTPRGFPWHNETIRDLLNRTSQEQPQ